MSELYTPPTVSGHGPLAIVLGLVFTGLLFLAMSIAQLANIEPPAKDEFEEVSFSQPPPEIEDLEEPEPPPPPEEEPPPEMEEPPPQISLDQIAANLNPSGGGAVSFDTGLPGVDAGTAGQFDASEVIDFSELDNQPSPIGQPRPNIPSRYLRRDPWKVVVHMIIGTDGTVEEITRIDSPIPELVAPIREAVEELRYQVGTKNGRPVRFPVAYPFEYKGR